MQWRQQVREAGRFTTIILRLRRERSRRHEAAIQAKHPRQRQRWPGFTSVCICLPALRTRWAVTERGVFASPKAPDVALGCGVVCWFALDGRNLEGKSGEQFR